MNIKHLFIALVAACSVSAMAQNYKVTVPLTEDEEGAMAYLINYDTGDKIDSVLVEDNMAVFEGTVNEPVAARVQIDRNRYMMILEPGEIVFDVANGTITGGNLNKEVNRLMAKSNEMSKEYRAATNKETAESIYRRFEEFQKQMMMDNINNALGSVLFMDYAYELEPKEVEDFVNNHPSLAKSKRVQKLVTANKNKALTQPGNKFADFEIEYEGVKHKLSDVVGKGDYVLVDFWASWCGPCIRQTAVLKDIYKEYKDKGLKILGVAVWDKPEDTKQAIVKHELPWESWLNGQTIPTDIYGISGIPCIILFGPDGTIISRDKQSDELRADVAAAMENVK